MKSVLPKFPVFKRVSLSHKKFVEDFVQRFPPYSDFNFTSIWTYDTEEQIQLSMLNGNLIVLFTDYITNKPFLSFIGDQLLDETVEELLLYAQTNKLPHHLKLIPQSAIDAFPNLTSKYVIFEDRDNHDYILSIKEIAELKGKKYYDKRNLINRFKKNYPYAGVKILDISKKLYQDEIKSLFMIWSQQTKKTIDETKTEMKAIERLFKIAPSIQCFAIGVYDNQKLVGFATYELTHKSHSVMSFEKGDRTYEGIYSLLNHETSKHLHSLGYRFINYEQDLGILGLRKAKTLWRPVHHLKKYVISPKG